MKLQSIWERCQRFISTARFLTIGQIVVVFVLGFSVHWLWRASAATSEESEEQVAHHHDEAGAQKWTCSMHPQIQKDGPGSCPICGMDLIPVTSGKTMGMRFLPVTPEARELMNIEVMPVERRYVEADIRMVGKVEYDETRMNYITAWVPGRLDRLFVDYTGVPVSKGDHMVYIYSEDLYAAQQELIVAARSAKRNPRERSILDTDGVDLLKSAREKLRLLGLTKEQIAEIEARDKPSDHMMIYAPIGGTVVQKLRQQGDRVKIGDRIYAIADLTHVWVVLDAYESDLEWIRYGQTVEITTEAYSGAKPLEGRIAFIHPVLNDKTRTVKVRVNVDNKLGLLKPEMFVHGIVRAKVAGKGRVIDPGLAGKWISPMHPEIVKDKPGKCDICGMELVRAESLGYVVTGDDKSAPLVIPVSAALKTGARAIVYVELPQFPRKILDKFQHVVDAMAHGGLPKIRNAFSELQAALAEPNGLLRTLYAQTVWTKYAGRIYGEVTRGAKATNEDEAQLAFDATKKAVDRLQEHFSPGDRSTFAGRQIVLGPRAGDYYLVRHGLAEGELVVTRGNFKIDSALQIEARPSMMTPDGGGGGGGHHHGGAPKSSGTQSSGSVGMELPIAMRRTLYHVITLSGTIKQYLKNGDLKSAQSKFNQIGGLVREIDDDAVEGHARLVWNDFRMLLSNDAFEGTQSSRLTDAARVLADLEHNLQRVDKQFGLSHGDHGPKKYDVSPNFQNQLARLWSAYTEISQTLAADNSKAAAAGATQLKTALDGVDMKLLTDQAAHMAWMRELAVLKSSIDKFSKANDIQTQRTHFKSISTVMQVLALSFGFGSDYPVYQHHCNMAFGNTGASWLQVDEKTRNPYFGSKMLRCAQQVQLIAGKKTGSNSKPMESHNHR